MTLCLQGIVLTMKMLLCTLELVRIWSIPLSIGCEHLFGLLKAEGELTQLAHKLMSDRNGYDPFFEDMGSLWLLHFNLINEDYATIYKSTFIDYHKQRNLIDGIKLQNFIKHLCFDGTSYKKLYNENTVKRDIGVLFHNYCNHSNCYWLR